MPWLHQEPTTLLNNFMLTYNTSKPIARVAAIIGPSGSGKTVLTQQLAETHQRTIRTTHPEGRDPSKKIIDILQTRNSLNEKLIIILENGEDLKQEDLKKILDRSILFIHPLVIHSSKRLQLPYDKAHMVWQVIIPSLSRYDIQSYLQTQQDPTLAQAAERFANAKQIGELVKLVDIFRLTGGVECQLMETTELKRDLQFIRQGVRVKKPLAQLNHQLANIVEPNQFEIIAESDQHTRHSEWWGQRILRYLQLSG